LIATGLNVGYSRYAPGTFGTLVAVPLSFLLGEVASVSWVLSAVVLTAVVLTAAWVCRQAEEIIGAKDSQQIVIDEIAGFLLATFLMPAKLTVIVAAFVLFRVFDIMKVFPAAALERARNGVLMDDVVAGLYTHLALRLLLFWEFL
jgi:phosphatidylglycerophosphatase A